MILREIFPGSSEVELDPKTAELSEATHWYPKTSGIRFNYVIDLTADSEQNSDASTNEIDRYFLRVIRSSSDLIITTGKTARAENLRASRFAPLAIITSKPNDFNIPATDEEGSQAVFICSPAEPETKYLNPKVKWLKTSKKSITEIVTEIRVGLNSEYTLLESGIESLRQIANRKLLDEICLTVTHAESREVATSKAEKFVESLGVVSEQIQLLNSEDTWFFRFKVSLES